MSPARPPGVPGNLGPERRARHSQGGQIVSQIMETNSSDAGALER